MFSTISFNTDLELCEEKYLLKYDGYTIEIEKGKSDTGNLLFIEGTTFEEIQEIGRRFLSEISWLYNTKINILAYQGSGSGKINTQIQPRNFYRIGKALDISDYEQIASLENQKLALGIFREGFSSESIFYSFLSYSRIINMEGGSKKQIKWINDNYNKINSYHELFSYISKETIIDIGEHLYSSGRCAIAHADASSSSIIVNPDNFADSNRIFNENKFIKELAVLYMVEVLGIPDLRKIHKIQKVRGFKQIFGDTINIFSFSMGDIDIGYFPKLPEISFGIYGYDYKFEVFHKLIFSVIKATKEGEVTLNNFSQDHPVKATIKINFFKYEVAFDIRETNFDRSHVLWCDKFELDHLHFLKRCIHNNRPLILDSKTGDVISKLDNYFLINARVDHERLDQQIKELEEKASKTSG